MTVIHKNANLNSRDSSASGITSRTTCYRTFSVRVGTVGKMRINLLIVVALLLTACADTASRLNEMHVGMNEGEVIKTLGDPETTTAMSGTEYMMYELRDAPSPSTQAGCAIVDLPFGGLAVSSMLMDECEYSNDLYFVRLIDGKVDAYGPRADFDSMGGSKSFRQIPPITITDIYTVGPNTAAGVDVRIRFTPIAQETIKYIRFWTFPYNRVGDTVRSTIDGESEKVLTTTGPYTIDDGSITGNWKNVWYNPSLSCVEITKVEVESMGGSIESYNAQQLGLVLRRSGLNDCSYNE